MLFGYMESLFTPWHLLILLVGGLCFAGFVVGVVLLVSRTRPQTRDDDRQSWLEEENQRLREEIDRLKKD